MWGGKKVKKERRNKHAHIHTLMLLFKEGQCVPSRDSP